MSGSRAQAAPEGVVNVYKPPGLTSHDVVSLLRRWSGQRRVGHLGTLDPSASGVLPLCLGRATRLAPYLSGGEKEYRGELVLGITTETQDAEGRVLRVEEECRVTPAELESAVRQLTGELEQVPPMYSAVKYRGQPLYRLARRGQTVERSPRRIQVYRFQIERVEPGERDRLGLGTRVFFTVVCSPGTYVRTLAHDLGQLLGCGAHLASLVRTRSGPFTLETALPLPEIEAAFAEGRWERVLVSMSQALIFLPAFRLPEQAEQALRHGESVAAAGAALVEEGVPVRGSPTLPDLVRVVDERGELVALARREQRRAAGAKFRPVCVLSPAGASGKKRPGGGREGDAPQLPG
ncbi:MAG: tRNA pseudouridine(55) synthase TruB [Bacillota bacterium]|nr:tRNA pseudouridine(55) synthase TruB [Bacillota bacterium]